MLFRSIGPVRLGLGQSQILEYLSRREFLVTLGGHSAGLERVKNGEKVHAEFPCYDDAPSPEELRRVGPFMLLARIVWRFSQVVQADGGQFRVVLIQTEGERKTGVMEPGHKRLLELARQHNFPLTDLSSSEGVPPELSLANRPDAWRPDRHFSEVGSEIVAARILHDARRDGQP